MQFSPSRNWSVRASIVMLSSLLAIVQVAEAQVIKLGTAFGNPDMPSGLTGVRSISSNGFNVACLKNDGTVVAFGSGANSLPGTGYKSVANGQNFTVGLKSDGTVVAVGVNTFGGLNVPSGLNNVVAVSTGDWHGTALKSDGTLVTWGGLSFYNYTAPSDIGTVVAFSCGNYHTLAVRSDGTVRAWGANDSGQCNVPSNLTNVVAVAGGYYHSMALKSDGTVVAWGTNTYGNLDVPAGLTGVIAIASNGYNSYALKSDHTVVAWGRNNNGQATVPAGLDHVVAISGLASGGQALRATTVADEYTVLAGQSLTVNASTGVLNNDFGINGFSAQLVSQANHGTVNLNADGSFTYTPSAYFAGDDTFVYRNTGPDFNTENATVTIHLSPVTQSLDASSVVGGQYARATLSLGTVKAPTGGMTFKMDYGTGLTGPATVTVPEGQTSVRFRALADTVDSDVSSSFHAVSGIYDLTSPVTIKPASLMSLVVNPGTVTGGGRVNGTVRLNGQAGPSGTTVNLTSGDPTVTVPSSVLIPAGKSSAPFVVTTNPVASATDVTLTAGGTATATLRVNPGVLRPLVFNRTSVPGGGGVIGTVQIDSPAPIGGLTVNLSSDNSAVPVPSILVIPAGQRSARFEVTTTPVDASQTAQVTVTLGAASQSSSVTVVPAGLSSFTATVSSWQSGRVGTLTLRLDGGAPSTGAAISVTSSDPDLVAPAVVTVPAGGVAKAFSVTTRRVSTTKTVTLTATYNGIAKTLVVTLNP